FQTKQQTHMNYEEERKLKAAVKISKGVWHCTSGALLAAGHGVLAIGLRTPTVRMPFARSLIESGQKTFKEGLVEWKHWNK
ncbi:MAG: hypothetical protein ACREDS_05990, partial [Limisphaerales bacterium]